MAASLPDQDQHTRGLKKRSVLLVFLSVCFLLSLNVDRTATPLWLDALPSTNVTNATSSHLPSYRVRIDAYFGLLWSRLLLTGVFGTLLLGTVLFSPTGTIGEREYSYPKKSIYLPSLFTPLGLIMINYASDGKRTAPYLQPVMVQARIPTIFLARFLILKRYPTLRKNLCALAVMVAVFVSLIPAIFPQLESEQAHRKEGGATGIAGVLWPLSILLAEIPFAVGAATFERALKDSKKDRNETDMQEVNFFYIMFWNGLFSSLNAILLFWTDLIPGYGFLDNIIDLGNMLRFNLLCVFGANECGVQAVVAFHLKMVFIVIQVTSSGLFLRYSEGANFLYLVSSLQGPMLLLFWTLFREDPFQWQPEVHLSTWLALLAFLIILPAIYVYYTGPPEKVLDKEPKTATGEREPLLGNDQQESAIPRTTEEYHKNNPIANDVKETGQRFYHNDTTNTLRIN